MKMMYCKQGAPVALHRCQKGEYEQFAEVNFKICPNCPGLNFQTKFIKRKLWIIVQCWCDHARCSVGENEYVFDTVERLARRWNKKMARKGLEVENETVCD
jgi:hypothetical protein